MGLLNFFFFKCEGEFSLATERVLRGAGHMSGLVLSLLNQRARSGEDTHILFLFDF